MVIFIEISHEKAKKWIDKLILTIEWHLNTFGVILERFITIEIDFRIQILISRH